MLIRIFATARRYTYAYTYARSRNRSPRNLSTTDAPTRTAVRLYISGSTTVDDLTNSLLYSSTVSWPAALSFRYPIVT